MISAGRKAIYPNDFETEMNFFFHLTFWCEARLAIGLTNFNSESSQKLDMMHIGVRTFAINFFPVVRKKPLFIDLRLMHRRLQFL